MFQFRPFSIATIPSQRDSSLVRVKNENNEEGNVRRTATFELDAHTHTHTFVALLWKIIQTNPIT